MIYGCEIDQKEARHCLLPIHGRQAQMSTRDFPLLVMPFMEWLLSMGQWVIPNMGRAVRPPSHRLLTGYKLARRDISAPLWFYAHKIRRPVLIW